MRGSKLFPSAHTTPGAATDSPRTIASSPSTASNAATGDSRRASSARPIARTSSGLGIS